MCMREEAGRKRAKGEGKADRCMRERGFLERKGEEGRPPPAGG